MALILTVMSYKGEAPSQPASARFDEAGGIVGRSPKATLHLPDTERVVSSVHAEIFHQDGTYFVTDKSKNGLYVNQSTNPLGTDSSVRLENDDRLTIGDYVLRVDVEGSAGPGNSRGVEGMVSTPAMGTDPLKGLAPGPASGPGGSVALPGSAPEIPGPGNLIPGDIAQPPPAPSGGSHSDGAPAIAHHFAPPKVMEQPAPQSGIPMDWHNQEDAPTPDASHGQLPPGAPVPAADGPAPPPRPGPPIESAPPRPAESAPGAGDHAFVRNALEAAGAGELDPAGFVGPELAARLGAIMREAVSGALELLAIRAQARSEFRLGRTVVGQTGNNPLKFTESREDAIRQLLGGQDAGMLAAEDALREAFDDIREHQLAMFAGMDAALRALVTRLAPDELALGAGEAGALGSLIPAGRNAKLWERFVEVHGEISRDAEEGFRELFATAFADAYEEQLRQLRHARKERRPG